jgi:hypothetical protein
MKEEIKNLQDKHKLREFMATNLALQNILKWILHAKEKDKNIRTQERINLSTRVDEQVISRKESNMRKTTEGRDLVHTFQ